MLAATTAEIISSTAIVATAATTATTPTAATTATTPMAAAVAAAETMNQKSTLGLGIEKKEKCEMQVRLLLYN